MKEMTSVASTMMSDEEKAEIEREMADGGAPASPPPVSPAPTPAATPAPASPLPRPADGPVPVTGATLVPSPARSPSPSSTSIASPGPGPATPGPEQDSLASASKSPASSSSTNLKDKDKELHKGGEREAHGKKRAKLSPEQKKKLQELEEERKRNMEERVETLTKKLVDRLRPFVEAQHPGAKDDPETAAFERKMRSEADDMKLESFGVELLHTIGNVYIMKATSFLKSRKFLGMCVSCFAFSSLLWLSAASAGRMLMSVCAQPRLLLEAEGEGRDGKGRVGRHRQRVSGFMYPPRRRIADRSSVLACSRQ